MTFPVTRVAKISENGRRVRTKFDVSRQSFWNTNLKRSFPLFAWKSYESGFWLVDPIISVQNDLFGVPCPNGDALELLAAFPTSVVDVL